MSNIIREIFVEDHVQQVSTETLRDLLRHALDFKFCMSQAQWRVKIFLFFKKCFFKFFFLKGVITDVSCISILIRFFDL